VQPTYLNQAFVTFSRKHRVGATRLLDCQQKGLANIFRPSSFRSGGGAISWPRVGEPNKGRYTIEDVVPPRMGGIFSCTRTIRQSSVIITMLTRNRKPYEKPMSKCRAATTFTTWCYPPVCFFLTSRSSTLCSLRVCTCSATSHDLQPGIG